MLQVTDDSGFLAVIVPAAYQSFVASDWTLEQLVAHFTAQMKERALLIWGTGLEGTWNVDLRFKESAIQGFREVRGGLHVKGGSLLVTNYESLSMAAQFDDVTLPEKHQTTLLVPLADGEYAVRIVQMFDPEQQESAGAGQADFVIEVVPAAKKLAPWKSIPWFEMDDE